MLCLFSGMSFVEIYDYLLSQLAYKIRTRLNIGYDISYKEFDELHFFPHYGRKNFKTEDEAWKYAEKFAEENRGKYVDIFVIRVSDRKPVSNYNEKRISNLKYIVI